MMTPNQARAHKRKWRAICSVTAVFLLALVYTMLVKNAFTMPAIITRRIISADTLQAQNILPSNPPAQPISALETSNIQQPPVDVAVPSPEEPKPASAVSPPAKEETPASKAGEAGDIGGNTAVQGLSSSLKNPEPPSEPQAAPTAPAAALPAPEAVAPAPEPAPASPPTAPKKAMFTVIVMGWKRHASLLRLLKSLRDAEYNGDPIDLDIRIDGGSGKDWDTSIAVAKAAEWPFGQKRVLINDKNEGLAAAWMKGWDPPSDDHRAMFLEDDITVSPLWYRFVQAMFKAYGDKPWMAGVTLQHQTLNAKTGGQHQIKNDNKPFGYKLLGSWGFSPHPKHWREFIKIDIKKHNPHVPGLVTSNWFVQVKKGSMWTQHFIWFSEKHDLFTIYINPGDKLSMAANYRERGEHYASTQGKDFELVSMWDPRWDSPDPTPNLYGWDCKPAPPPKDKSIA